VTLYELNALDMDARAAYLWQHGDYLTGIVDQQGRSNFYALHGYFVEVELFDDRGCHRCGYSFHHWRPLRTHDPRR
jgi:hypothetical protein